MDSRTIWQEKQNKPTYIVRDLSKFGIHPDMIYDSLLRRGVFKWFAVRRDLIRLKDEWKTEIRSLNRKKTLWEKGYLAAMEKCREQVRELCHSERFRAPQCDLGAQRYLDKLGK
jgi:hypothetical protein